MRGEGVRGAYKLLPELEGQAYNIPVPEESDLEHLNIEDEMSVCSTVCVCQLYVNWLSVCRYVCVFVCLGVCVHIYSRIYMMVTITRTRKVGGQ